MAAYTLIVNGQSRRVVAPSGETLLSVLRNRLQLTGTKYGCGEGACGACTVLLGGRASRSCQIRVADVGTRKITTIEGLATGDKLHPVQQAFLDAQAFQCGYCTSGMIVAAAALLEANRAPTEAQIAKHLQGNVCRCGTYRRIVAAVQAAGRAQGGE